MEAIAQTTTESQVKTPEFGNGAYSSFMLETWKDAMAIFKLDAERAEVFARKLATELGAIRAAGRVEIFFGKMNKDAKFTLSEFSRVKGVTMTNTFTAAKALAFANQAVKNGFSRNKTEWHVMPESELESFLRDL
jgi:hypothetical protein